MYLYNPVLMCIYIYININENRFTYHPSKYVCRCQFFCFIRHRCILNILPTPGRVVRLFGMVNETISGFARHTARGRTVQFSAEASDGFPRIDFCRFLHLPEKLKLAEPSLAQALSKVRHYPSDLLPVMETVAALKPTRPSTNMICRFHCAGCVQ